MPAFPSLASLAAVTILLSTLAQAENWQTVDDFTGGGTNAEAHGVAVDSAGGIYVVGMANGHAIVRYSRDEGASWSVRDDFVYPSESNNVFNAIAIDFQGNVFVGGSSQNRGTRWIVRRSIDQGGSWQTVDDIYSPMIDPNHPGTNGAVYSLSSDTQGRVYGAGPMHLTGPSYNRWWVRGSDSGGTNWDTRLVLFSGYVEVSQITCPGEDVYVAGQISDSEISAGLILRSSDYGATWSTNFESTNELCYAITSDSQTNVYAAGIVRSNAAGFVREQPSFSTNWTVLDQFGVWPSSVTVDVTGNICVAGHSGSNYVVGTTNNYISYPVWTWLTRQYSVATSQWSTTDLFSYSTNLTNMLATATGSAIAPDGGTFVVGWGTSNSGQHHWLVRKRGGRPHLQIIVGGGSVTVSWPTGYTNSVLEWSDASNVGQIWHACTNTVSVVAGRNTATFAVIPGGRFYRLNTSVGP